MLYCTTLYTTIFTTLYTTPRLYSVDCISLCTPHPVAPRAESKGGVLAVSVGWLDEQVLGEGKGRIM